MLLLLSTLSPNHILLGLRSKFEEEPTSDKNVLPSDEDLEHKGKSKKDE